MAGNETTDMDEILAESVRKLPVLYDKSAKDFKDKHKKERAWDDVAKEVGFPTGKSFMGYFLSLISLDFRKLNGRTFEQAALDVFNFCQILYQ